MGVFLHFLQVDHNFNSYMKLMSKKICYTSQNLFVYAKTVVG